METPVFGSTRIVPHVRFVSLSSTGVFDVMIFSSTVLIRAEALTLLLIKPTMSSFVTGSSLLVSSCFSWQTDKASFPVFRNFKFPFRPPTARALQFLIILSFFSEVRSGESGFLLNSSSKICLTASSVLPALMASAPLFNAFISALFCKARST